MSECDEHIVSLSILVVVQFFTPKLLHKLASNFFQLFCILFEPLRRVLNSQCFMIFKRNFLQILKTNLFSETTGQIFFLYFMIRVHWGPCFVCDSYSQYNQTIFIFAAYVINISTDIDDLW